MKKKCVILILLPILLVSTNPIKGQSITSQTFTVNGDFDKFYPVVFSETNWYDGATEFEITRSDVHTNSNWRGSLVAKFRVHTTRWGHGSNFINVEIKTNVTAFIADWKDATGSNGTTDIIVWLRGGGTTYYFRSVNSSILLPVVYINGYQEVNGPFQSYYAVPNPNINQNGMNYSGSAYFWGNGIYYGNVGINTTNPQNALDVNGTIRSKEVKVETNWADFVFARDYKLRTLKEVETYIAQHGSLPEIPTAEEVEENGVSLGEMNAKLLQKVEELTLYSIKQQKNIDKLIEITQKQNKEIEMLKENGKVSF